MAKKVQPSMGCGYVVFVILLAGGLALLGAAAAEFRSHHERLTASVLVLAIIGAILAAGSLTYLRFAKGIVAKSVEEAARRAQFPNQPWKWKEEWQREAIEPSGGAVTAGLWFFAILWNAISFTVFIVLLGRGFQKPGEYLVGLFPLVGVGLLWAAIYQTVRRRKYGRTRFVPSSLPGVIGGYLGGVIEVPARVVPEADAHLSLRCVRRETRGSGKNRRTTDNVLWEREELIARDQWVSGAGGTRIPVLFYIPPGQPDTDDSDSNNEIVWRLSASAATAGVDFATQFNVPVFATGETAAPPEAGAPMLDEYKAQPLDGAALATCGVRREGETFHFSASHLPVTKAVTAILMLGIFGLLVWFATQDVPGGVWAITIFFGLIIGLFAGSVWFDKYQLRIEADTVAVSRPRPWGTSVVRVPRAEVARVEIVKSMSSGENQYFCLSLTGAAGVDPAGPAHEGEPFVTRKLRFQLARVEKGDAPRPRAEILADLQRAPKFKVAFARHIPGQGRAEAIAALVMGSIRGKG